MYNYKHILSMFLVFMFISYGCQKQLDYGASDFEPEIVLNSVFTPDSLWVIYLASTEDIFDPSDSTRPIVDATILLEDRNTGQEISIQNNGDGSYTSKGVKPQEGHLYEIFVNASGYKSVSAVSYVPSIPKVEIKEIKEHFIDDNSVFEVNMEIEDGGDEQNYYIWEIVQNTENIKDVRGQLFNGSDLQKLRKTLDGAAAVKTRRPYPDKLLFLSDSGFNGEVHNASFFAIPPRDPGTIIEIGTGGSENPLENPPVNTNLLTEKLSIKVRAVSLDLFEHIKSLEEYKNSSTSYTNLKNGANIFSNVDNGLGIFGAYSLTMVEI